MGGYGGWGEEGEVGVPCASRTEHDLHDGLRLRQQTPRLSALVNIGPLCLALNVVEKVTWG